MDAAVPRWHVLVLLMLGYQHGGIACCDIIDACAISCMYVCVYIYIERDAISRRDEGNIR